MDALRNNRENYRRNAFGQKKKKPRLTLTVANRPSNNWVLVGSAIQLLNNWGQVPWECCPTDYKLTAVTTNTLPQRVFSGDVNQPLPRFSRVGQVKILSPFLEHSRRKISAFKPFSQYFAIGSDTASCKDYEEYEFVELLSEENQNYQLMYTL